MEPRPLDISCIDLDGLREQLKRLGYAIVSNARPMTQPRRLILEAILGKHEVIFRDPVDNLSVPIIEEPFAQKIIQATREDAELSSCMWRKVGAALGDPTTLSILRRTHNAPIGEGEFCKELGVDLSELLRALHPGERLEFCHAQHAESAMAVAVHNEKIEVGDKFLGINVDPCDSCANLWAGLRPKGVYLDFNPNRRYYNALGIKVLQRAKIPTCFVRMPNE